MGDIRLHPRVIIERCGEGSSGRYVQAEGGQERAQGREGVRVRDQSADAEGRESVALGKRAPDDEIPMPIKRGPDERALREVGVCLVDQDVRVRRRGGNALDRAGGNSQPRWVVGVGEVDDGCLRRRGEELVEGEGEVWLGRFNGAYMVCGELEPDLGLGPMLGKGETRAEAISRAFVAVFKQSTGDG